MAVISGQIIVQGLWLLIMPISYGFVVMMALLFRLEMLRLMSNSNGLCFSVGRNKCRKSKYFSNLFFFLHHNIYIHHGYQEAQYANQVMPILLNI